MDLQPPPALKGAARRRLRLLPLPLVVLAALMLTAGGPWRTVSVSRRPERELTIFQAINPPNGELGLEVEGVALRSAGSVISQIR